MVKRKESMQNNRTVGTIYEQLAGEYLEQKGYEILCYNFRCPLGEIDIIARDAEVLVFTEIKYRKTAKLGSPLAAVTSKKQKVISKCANYYLTGKGWHDISCRFDVIGIEGKELTHVENAFDYQG